jgi:hypothetical protein
MAPAIPGAAEAGTRTPAGAEIRPLPGNAVSWTQQWLRIRFFGGGLGWWRLHGRPLADSLIDFWSLLGEVFRGEQDGLLSPVPTFQIYERRATFCSCPLCKSDRLLFWYGDEFASLPFSPWHSNLRRSAP